MKKFAILLVVVLTTTGCVSTRTMEVLIQEKVDGPKVVAMSGSREPWVIEIERRLRERGFEVLRMPSQLTAVEQVSTSRTEVFNEAAARFILVVNGYAPNTSLTRCFGGGYNFESITVELIDAADNKTAMYYSNSGYSENCPPLSGTIFTDIVNGVDQIWK